MATIPINECPLCNSDQLKIREWKFKTGGHQFRQQCLSCGWYSFAIAKDIALKTNKSEIFEPIDLELHKKTYIPKTPPEQDNFNITYANQMSFDNL